MNHIVEKELVRYAFLVFLELQFVGCFLCSSGVWAVGISSLSVRGKKKNTLRIQFRV